ncbi:hypothetical protein AGLY_012114 [Aphis glycines]|uniref:Uncharacterized protein n=1 Tax=Aphis glycines TaxID=307491 RepID=A0A6G0T975_APHGL|nr:hypothetical protein AGLY_012114 [Aphis glycines]
MLPKPNFFWLNLIYNISEYKLHIKLYINIKQAMDLLCNVLRFDYLMVTKNIQVFSNKSNCFIIVILIMIINYIIILNVCIVIIILIFEFIFLNGSVGCQLLRLVYQCYNHVILSDLIFLSNPRTQYIHWTYFRDDLTSVTNYILCSCMSLKNKDKQINYYLLSSYEIIRINDKLNDIFPCPYL